MQVLSLSSHDPYKGMVQLKEPPARYDVIVRTSGTLPKRRVIAAACDRPGR